MQKGTPGRPISDLRRLTPARVGLGRAGVGLPTPALLAFTLDHARARDAVHAAFASTGVVAAMRARGLRTSEGSSRAGHREDYLRRPDLGRQLDEASRQTSPAAPTPAEGTLAERKITRGEYDSGEGEPW